MKALQKKWNEGSRELARRDARLGRVIKAVGPPTPGFCSDPFQALSEAILSQQLAGAAAKAIIGRFAEFSPPFPKPTQLARWRVAKLRTAGVSQRKAETIIDLAKAWNSGLSKTRWSKLSNDEVLEQLTPIKGVGPWTCHMFLIFSLGRTDILATGDYGVRKAIGLLNKKRKLPSPKQVEELSKKWKGLESIACWYLWKGLDRGAIS